jgi:hypothetical protein
VKQSTAVRFAKLHESLNASEGFGGRFFGGEILLPMCRSPLQPAAHLLAGTAGTSARGSLLDAAKLFRPNACRKSSCTFQRQLFFVSNFQPDGAVLHSERYTPSHVPQNDGFLLTSNLGESRSLCKPPKGQHDGLSLLFEAGPDESK